MSFICAQCSVLFDLSHVVDIWQILLCYVMSLKSRWISVVFCFSDFLKSLNLHARDAWGMHFSWALTFWVRLSEMLFWCDVSVSPWSSHWEQQNWAWPLGTRLQHQPVWCPDLTSRLKYNLGEKRVPFFCLKHLSPICVEVNSGHPGVCQPWLPFITNGAYHISVWPLFLNVSRYDFGLVSLLQAHK